MKYVVIKSSEGKYVVIKKEAILAIIPEEYWTRIVCNGFEVKTAASATSVIGAVENDEVPDDIGDLSLPEYLEYKRLRMKVAAI